MNIKMEECACREAATVGKRRKKVADGKKTKWRRLMYATRER